MHARLVTAALTALLLGIAWITGAVALAGARDPAPDFVATNQDGKRVGVYRDVLAGRPAVLHFMYTTCASFCPVSGSVLSRTQSLLDKGSPALDYRFVSISIAPASTTPARLKQWLSRYRASARWQALHVPEPQLTTVMRHYGESPGDIVNHSGQMIILDRRGRVSRRFEQAPDPAKLAEALRRADVD